MQTNEDNLDRLLKEMGAGENATEKIRRAADQNPAVAQALSRMTKKDISGIRAILSDKRALKSLLSTPKAQNMLNKLKN